MLRRRLPSKAGGNTIFVSPDAALSLWKRQVDSDLFAFAEEFVAPGHVVWDVGANVGLLAFSAAQAQDRRVMWLPSNQIFFLSIFCDARQRYSRQLAPPVAVLPVAVSDSLAVREFNIAMRGRASNFLSQTAANSQTGGIRETVHTLTITLDWLLGQRRPPNVVKIDVEGAELPVLRGAMKLLREVRPILHCEIMSENSAAASELLKSCSYALYDWDNRKSGPIEQAAWNTLAIPQSL